MGVRASLRVLRLIPRPTEHPASPSEQIRHRGVIGIPHGEDPETRKEQTFQPHSHWDSNLGSKEGKLLPTPLSHAPVGNISDKILLVQVECHIYINVKPLTLNCILG